MVVEISEAKKQKNCWCDKLFLETDVRSLVNHMREKEEIWESTHMNRESFADLTIELNKMFSKYSINKCIQKIAFLANVHSETSFLEPQEKNQVPMLLVATNIKVEEYNNLLEMEVIQSPTQNMMKKYPKI